MYGHLFAQILGFEGMPFKFIYDLGGKAAVMVFLLISGISIGYSYANNKRGFLKRRFLRIYPLYFIAVVLGVFLQYYIASPYYLPNSTMIAAGSLTSIANILLLQGIASITITYNAPLWSLGVEAFLYLMVPLLVHLRLRYILLITFMSMFAIMFLNYSFLYGYLNLIWAWPFLIGVIITVKKQFLYSIPLLMLSILIVFYQKSIFSDSLSVLTAILGVLLSCSAMFMKLEFSKQILKVFNFLGTISYPIYVFHWPLYILLYYLGISEPYTLICIVILLSVILNYIFDDYFKKIFWKPVVNKLENIKSFKVRS